MRITCLADLHMTMRQPVARLDDAAETRFRKFMNIFDSNADPVLIAGDIFDKPKEWPALSRITKILKRCNKTVVCCFGQHDVSFYQFKKRHETSLGVLEKAGLVWCPHDDLFFQIGGEEMYRVYGMNFEDKEVPKVIGPANILIIHAPIADTEVWPGGEYIDAVDFAAKHQEFELIVCGDIHRRFVKKVGKTTILNPGPLLRAEASEYNFTYEPGYFVYDTDTRKTTLVKIRAEKASDVLTREHIEKKDADENMLKELVEKVRKTKIEGVNLLEEIRKALREDVLSDGAKRVVEDIIDG